MLFFLETCTKPAYASAALHYFFFFNLYFLFGCLDEIHIYVYLAKWKEVVDGCVFFFMFLLLQTCAMWYISELLLNTLYVRLWFFSWLESQSKPSYKPSPLVAHVACIYQLRFLSECSPNLSVISAAFIAFGKS